jgi:serine/threonine protein kinase
MSLDILRALNILPLADRYTCDELVSTGQSARSFFGIDQKTGQPIHVKILIAPRSTSEVARFKNEAFALKHISQFPQGGNVPKFVEHGILLNDEIHFIVTERAEGMTLANWLTKHWEAATSDQRLEMFHRVATALSPGCSFFTHRDLHPENVFLLDKTPDWRTGNLPQPYTLILDWGQAFMPLLARTEGSPDFAITLHNRLPKEIIGSFYALPPDVFFPKSDALLHPGKHDAWSLGLMLHRILTGRTLISFASIGEYVESCQNGSLMRLLVDATHEIETLEYPSSLVLARLFEKLTSMHPGPRYSPANAGRVMWDIRIEGFAPTNPVVISKYISNPHTFEPDDGWKFSSIPDYE